MNLQKGTLIATAMIAFSTSLGVLIALISFIYQMRRISILELFVYIEMYISLNLLVLLILKRVLK